MSKDGLLPPGTEHSHPNFWGEEKVTCDCGHPVSSHGPSGMDPCQECIDSDQWCGQFEPYWEDEAA